MKVVSYYLNLIRSDKGQETPIIVNTYYFFYYITYFNDPIIPNNIFN
jgi:hypothetical protein